MDTREALEKAERAILIHSFAPQHTDKDTCSQCLGNFRSKQHLRADETPYTVRRDALEAIEAALAAPPDGWRDVEGVLDAYRAEKDLWAVSIVKSAEYCCAYIHPSLGEAYASTGPTVRAALDAAESQMNRSTSPEQPE